MDDYDAIFTRYHKQYQDHGMPHNRQSRLRIYLCVALTFLFCIGCHLLIIQLENAGHDTNYDDSHNIGTPLPVSEDFLLNKLGSRNTSAFVKLFVETILIDSTITTTTASKRETTQRVEQKPDPNQSNLNISRISYTNGNVTTNYDNHLYKIHNGKNTSRLIPSPPPFVIFMVLSDFHSADQRAAIRQTWAQWAKFYPDIQIIFFLGVTLVNNLSQKDLSIPVKIEKEIEKYHDIIIDSILEDYYLLSVKVLRMLKWFHKKYPNDNFRPQFLVKVEQGVFVNVPNFLKHLYKIEENSPNSQNYMGGILYDKTRTVQDFKMKSFKASDIFISNLRFFPPHLAKPCYIMGGDLAVKILHASLSLPLFHMEDVFISGIVANATLHTELHDLHEPQIIQHIPAAELYANFKTGDNRPIAVAGVFEKVEGSSGNTDHGNFKQQLSTSFFLFPVHVKQMREYYSILQAGL